jgi:hypothetical protein
MRLGPATQAASFVVSCSAWSPLDGGMMLQPGSARKHCRICQSQLPVRHLAITNLQPTRRPAVLSCFFAPKSKLQDGGGGRIARATSRACARFLECPPAIHPRESPAAAGSAAIIRQAQELSRFAEPTLRQIVSTRNTKNLPRCAEAVEDVTSLWKTEEN